MGGGAVAASATIVGDFLGCVEPDFLLKVRRPLAHRFGYLKVGGTFFFGAGMKVPQANDSSAQLTQKNFTKALRPNPAALTFSASFDEIKVRHYKLREFCLMATVSLPDICPRLARLAARANPPDGSDVFRIHDLAETGNRVKIRPHSPSPCAGSRCS